MTIIHLNDQAIKQQANNYPGKVIVYDSIVSTQTRAKELLAAGLPAPFTVAANSQTNGYGRHGRHFYSPADTGLYFSIAAPLLSTTPPNSGLLTTGMAVIVGNALQQHYPNSNFMYKWVNDIYLDAKKVCGIIAETEQNNNQTNVIVGVGINITTNNFPDSLQDKAHAINPGRQIDRNHLLATILSSTTDFFASYQTGYFLPEYRRRSLVLGKKITIHYGRKFIKGIATAIDQTGKLVLTDQQGGSHRFASGEVTKIII